MSNIHGIQPPIAPKAIDAADTISAGSAKVTPPSISDVIEISDVAKLAAKIGELPPVRTELVERVKAQIVAGTYETTEKLDIAADRLMDDLFGEVV